MEEQALSRVRRQKYSLKNYLDTHVGEGFPGWTVWLRNIQSKDVPRGPNNILPAKFTLNGLLNWIAETTRLTRDGHEFVLTATRLSDELPIQSAVEFLLTARIEPRHLIAVAWIGFYRHLSKIIGCRNRVVSNWYFAGEAGPGKTMLLLQLAWRLHNERGRKILLLTYNHALLADLRRLMTLLGISDDISMPLLPSANCPLLFSFRLAWARRGYTGRRFFGSLRRT